MKKLFTAAIISIALIGSTAQAAGPVSYKDATTALNSLKVADEVRTGYKRTLFKHWVGTGNGCDSRNDILKRDLTKVVFKAGTNSCKVIAGTLLDPYSNKLIEFDSKLKEL